ncbi:heavy-metal-associated domain-containing protein [Streptomyces sp. AJS327]|nr:heavy-metal-associated domain-containing protein [Streptomyces sp. AJS327]
MACAHCVGFLTDEIERINGVRDVTVDVRGGTVIVTSERQLDPDEVRDAVEDAGYEVSRN